jgi:hypothetical protein
LGEVDVVADEPAEAADDVAAGAVPVYDGSSSWWPL